MRDISFLVALKHHTSKLSSFEDLNTVQSFGFRGEALSALCALAGSVTVVTATADTAPMGTIIEFDRQGKVANCSGRVARQVATHGELCWHHIDLFLFPARHDSDSDRDIQTSSCSTERVRAERQARVREGVELAQCICPHPVCGDEWRREIDLHQPAERGVKTMSFAAAVY